MKKVMILALLTTCLISYGQVQDSIKNEEHSIAIERFSENYIEQPLFVISHDKQTIQLTQKELFGSTKIKPEWIQSMNILRGQAALDQYGERGKNGVVIIELIKESLDLLPPEMKEKLSGYKIDSKNR